MTTQEKEELKICPRCKKNKFKYGHMWDCEIEGKRDLCVVVCSDCHKELGG